MARTFATGSSEFVHFAIGALSGLNRQGAWTFASILRRNSISAWHCPIGLNTALTGAGTSFLGIEFDGTTNKLILGTTSGTNAVSTTVAAQGTWYAVFVTTPANTIFTTAARFHFLNLSTWTWTHEAATISVSTRASATLAGTASIRVGDFENNDFFDGDIQRSAIWSVEMSDVQCESMGTSLRSWLARQPKFLREWRDADVAVVSRDMTGNASDETSRTGTSVSTQSAPFVRYGSSGRLFVPSTVVAARSLPPHENRRRMSLYRR